MDSHLVFNIELSENHGNYLLPFGLSVSKPCAHSDIPFDRLRANGDVVMVYGKINKTTTAHPARL